MEIKKKNEIFVWKWVVYLCLRVRKSSTRTSDGESDVEKRRLKRQDSRKKLERSMSKEAAAAKKMPNPGDKLIELEKSETGKVSMKFARGGFCQDFFQAC